MDLTSVAEPKLLNSGSSFFSSLVWLLAGFITGPRLFNKLRFKYLVFLSNSNWRHLNRNTECIQKYGGSYLNWD